MSGYVIYKSTRLPRTDSYAGPTWDFAGIRDQFREVYADRGEAERIARELTKFNAVGFEVAAVQDVLVGLDNP